MCAESNVQTLEEIVSSLYKQLEPIYEYHDTFLREVGGQLVTVVVVFVVVDILVVVFVDVDVFR